MTTLAHVCLVECESSRCRLDWQAIPHVLRKRQARYPALQGLTLAEVARRYSVPIRRRTARARRIMQYPLGAPKHWGQVVATVRAVLAGTAPDPCPAATGWAGRGDTPRPGNRRVCRAVPTRNRLFAAVMKGTVR